MNTQDEDTIIDIDLEEEMETEKHLHYADLAQLLTEETSRYKEKLV